MNEFYQQEKLSNQQLNDHNDENKLYKDAFVAQVMQHWNVQSLNSQHSSNEHFPQPSVDPLSSTSNLSNEISSTPTDKNGNKNELSKIVDESNKPLTTMKKRVTPIPASYIRRRPNLINQRSNPELLTPNNKTKLGHTRTTRKKPTKSAPIFIPPKKTSSHPRPFSSPKKISTQSNPSSAFIFDDSLQIKRKPILERQTAVGDNHNKSPSMTTWTPALSTSPGRFRAQTSGSSLDEDSSDESEDESLFIRKRNSKIKKQEFHSSFPTYGNIPSAIFITDPYGYSHTFDPDNDIPENIDHNEQISDNDLDSTDKNTLFPTTTFETSSSPEIVVIPSTPPIILDKHTLDSIGEEEENEDAVQTNTQKKDQSQIDKEPLSRRWSDGITDEEKKQISPSQASLTKMESVPSVTKQTENSPVKFSKTKYLLMKLHLISPSKDDESNLLTPKPRTVRRSKDKKHSRLKLTTNDSNKSSNTLTPDEPNQRLSEQKKPEIFSSVGNLNAIDDTDDEEDDIDGAIEQAKIDLQKRSSSFVDIRGSRLSLNSITSDTKARYGLDISGTIELKLTYTLKTGALDVSINKCTDLAKAKRHQTSDPFVKVYLLPDRSKNSKRKTATQKGTTNPVFEERFRYHITKQEFDTRVLWISVWSQSSLGTLGSNDFLGEIHIPLANCILDETQEYQLLARKNKKELRPNIQPTMDPGEIKFRLTFIENPKTKGIGVIQVDNIEGKSIYHGKMLVDCICKGLLMPDNVKRKLPTIRKGPTPRWEIPLRWEGVRLDNLKNTSIEISIWSQERVKKFKLGFVRLNLAHGHFGNRPVPWLDSTSAEKSKWEAFIRNPSEKHNIHLPLRPALVENK